MQFEKVEMKDVVGANFTLWLGLPLSWLNLSCFTKDISNMRLLAL
jgi:hypothetical protein